MSRVGRKRKDVLSPLQEVLGTLPLQGGHGRSSGNVYALFREGEIEKKLWEGGQKSLQRRSMGRNSRLQKSRQEIEIFQISRRNQYRRCLCFIRNQSLFPQGKLPLLAKKCQFLEKEKTLWCTLEDT